MISINTTTAEGKTALFLAVEDGHLEMALGLLDHGADPDIALASGRTPLFVAAQHKRLEMLLALLEKGADPNIALEGGKTALFAATERGFLEVVQALLSKGANPDLALEDGKTPLFVAAVDEDIDMVLALLKSGANPNLALADGRTSLFAAANEGDHEIVMALLDNRADCNLAREDGATPLFIAAEKGDFKVVLALLEKGADPNKELKVDGTTPLFAAADEGHLEVVRLLLDNRADPNLARTNGGTPLHVAIQCGYTATVHALLAKGADPYQATTDGETALYLAAESGKTKAVRALLQAGGNPDEDMGVGISPLFIAAERGHLDVVLALLEKGADPNKKREDGFSPLFMAAQNGKTKVVLALLDKADSNPALTDIGFAFYLAAACGKTKVVRALLDKVDPNMGKEDGTNPLYIAAERGHLGVVRALLEKESVDPDKKCNDGRTPLFVAAQNGKKKVVRALLCKANADEVLEDGTSPLFVAAEYGHLGVVRTLLRKSRNPNRKRIDGATPLFIAAAHGKTDVVRLLLTRFDANEALENGTSPLFVAAQFGHLDVVEALLGKADPDMARQDGMTPLHIAAYNGHLEVARALLGRADPNKTTRTGQPALLVAIMGRRPSLVELLLADPRTDPNSATRLLAEDAVTGLTPYLRTLMPVEERAIFDRLDQRAKKIWILQKWARVRLADPEQEKVSKLWKAHTNFVLGNLLAEVEETRPLPADSCEKGAVFHLTMALEQRLASPDHTLPEYARTLLEKSAQSAFVLHGVSVPRGDIEDMALERGDIGLQTAGEMAMQRLGAGWQPDAHWSMFPLQSQNLLDEMQQRIAAHQARNEEQQSHAVSAGVIARLQEDLSQSPLSLVIATGLYPEYAAVFNDKQYEPELLRFLQETDDDGSNLGTSLLERIQAQDQTQFAGANQFFTRAQLAQRQTLPEVLRMLHNIRVELRYFPKLSALIERETAVSRPEEIDLDLPAYLEARPGMTLTSLATYGVKQTWSQTIPIDEADRLKTDTHSALRIAYDYMNQQANDELKKNLAHLLFSRLVQIGRDLPCNTGCVERLLLDIPTVDTSLASKEPEERLIREVVESRISVIAAQFDEEFEQVIGRSKDAFESVAARAHQGSSAGGSESFGIGEQDEMHYGITPADHEDARVKAAAREQLRADVTATLAADKDVPKSHIPIRLMQAMARHPVVPSTLETKTARLQENLSQIQRTVAEADVTDLIRRRGWRPQTAKPIIDQALTDLFGEARPEMLTGGGPNSAGQSASAGSAH